MKAGTTTAGTYERRGAERHPGNFGASIVIDRDRRISCLVKNFSKTGALLSVLSVLGIPDEFHLQAAGLRRRVLVQWRQGCRLGVRFV